MDLEFKIQKLNAEIIQLENDIKILKEMKKSVNYEQFKTDFEVLIKKLLDKKRYLNLKFKKLYAELLE
jgi:hypothetical protein